MAEKAAVTPNYRQQDRCSKTTFSSSIQIRARNHRATTDDKTIGRKSSCNTELRDKYITDGYE